MHAPERFPGDNPLPLGILLICTLPLFPRWPASESESGRYDRAWSVVLVGRMWWDNELAYSQASSEVGLHIENSNTQSKQAFRKKSEMLVKGGSPLGPLDYIF